MIRDQIKTLRDENNRLKEQLLKFLVQNSPDPNDTTTSSNPADSSDQGSLYQMLQEYMVENQHLKEENENLKVERSDFVEKLEREKTTNEKITREVVAYLASSNRNNQTNAMLDSLRQTHIHPSYPYQPPFPYSNQPQYMQYMPPPTRFPPDEYVYYNGGQPRIDQWRHTNPASNTTSQTSIHSAPKLPDIALQGGGSVTPRPGGPQSRRLQRETSASRIPRYTADRNQQYANQQYNQLNSKAQKDINEINRQIKLYKKLNRSQR